MPDKEISSTKIGPFELFAVETGRFRLDGGAMFGVVPKTLWSRQIEPDDLNRIPMAMRCLLIKSENSRRIYLVDNGAGTKFNEKMQKIYNIDYNHSELIDSLAQCGVSPDDITDLIFTHLHFDHCGGTTFYDDSDLLQHRFTNAKYHVNERHLESALHPNAREKASFLSENIGPVSASDRLHKVSDNYIFEEGLYTIPADGHTAGQQMPVIEGDGKTLVFAADLVPTHVHIPLPWVMGYDMEPLKTLKEKEEYLTRAADQGWYLFLEHDPDTEIITVQHYDGKFSVDDRFTLGEV